MKIKKYMLPFLSIIVLIIITITIFLILITGSKNSSVQTAGDSTVNAIESPTRTVTPSPTPEPTQAPVATTELFPAYDIVDNQNVYGYIDKTGNYVITPTFSSASDFHDGVALVTLEDKYCVIDEGGNVLFTNDNPIGEFSNGFASYTSWDGKDISRSGYIDAKGNIVIEAKYLMTTNFSKEGTAYVLTGVGSYALIDQTGKELETYTLDSKYENAWGLKDGYLIYSTKDTYQYGVVNVKGEEILKPVYSEITYLGEGLFAVEAADSDNYEDVMTAKQAIFNSSGEQLSDFCYYDLNPYQDGYTSATDDTSTFFVGLDGKKVDSLPAFEGRGTLRIFGDVISAYIDEAQAYYTLDKKPIWELPTSIRLTDTLQVNKIKLRPNRNVLVIYPELEGLTDSTVQKQINDRLLSIFTDSRKDITLADMMTTSDHFSARLMKNLLVIERDGYDYNLGAAHGMPIIDFIFVDIHTGAFYQLKDLFKTDSDYTSRINDLINDEITAASETENSMYFPDSFKGIAENQFFKLDEDSLIIYFYPYDIAPYAAGFPEFDIPFNDILDLIDTNGAFWNAFQAGIQ